jgi:hypothetical protein
MEIVEFKVDALKALKVSDGILYLEFKFDFLFAYKL